MVRAMRTACPLQLYPVPSPPQPHMAEIHAAKIVARPLAPEAPSRRCITPAFIPRTAGCTDLARPHATWESAHPTAGTMQRRKRRPARPHATWESAHRATGTMQHRQPRPAGPMQRENQHIRLPPRPRQETAPGETPCNVEIGTSGQPPRAPWAPRQVNGRRAGSMRPPDSNTMVAPFLSAGQWRHTTPRQANGHPRRTAASFAGNTHKQCLASHHQPFETTVRSPCQANASPIPPCNPKPHGFILELIYRTQT